MQIYTNIWWSLLDWVEKPLESTVSDKSWFPFVRDFSQSEGTLTFSHHQTYWNKIWKYLERKINFANEYKYKWRENDNSWKFGTGEDNPYHPDLNPEPQPLGSTQNRQNNNGAILSSVMDTFLTVFVLQSKNEKRYGSNQCIPVLIYIWTKVCPIRYFGFAR